MVGGRRETALTVVFYVHIVKSPGMFILPVENHTVITLFWP